MKLSKLVKFASICVALVLFGALAFAQAVRISGFPRTTTLKLTDLFLIADTNAPATNRAITYESIRTLLSIQTNLQETATLGANAVRTTNNTSSATLSLGAASPAASALIDMVSTTKGALIPRLTEAQRDGIVSPATGLLVFNTTTTNFNYYTGAAWIPVVSTIINEVTLNNVTVSNVVFINGNGNRVTITNSLILLPAAAFSFDTSLGDLSWREASVVFSAAASFDTGLGLSVSAASSPFGTSHAGGLPYRNMVTTTTLNNDATFNGEGMWNITNQMKAQFVVALSQLTSNRVWVGFGNTTWANMMASDAPAFDHMGFLYSPAPAIGESHWICATSDGTTQTTNSSAFVVVTNQTLLGLSVTANAGSVVFYINGSPVVTNTTNLPRVSQSTMRWGVGIRTLESTVAKTASMAFLRTRARIPGLGL